MDWDNLKIFLAVARRGSVRGAADELTINQSTVSRRITAFEKSIGTKLFEKLPSGYVITEAGESILGNVETIEEKVFSIDRSLFSQKDELSGSLKLALPVPLATDMLMPDISAFAREHPTIRLDISVSASPTNLAKRETDVAIRIIKIGETPPEYLVGRKLVTYAESAYVARSRVNKVNCWIGNSETDINPDWVSESVLPNIEVGHSIDNLVARLQAVKSGMGMAILPCGLADTEEELIRVPNAILQPGREIWLLTHVDLKNTPRVKLFKAFIHEVFKQRKDLFEGKTPK